MADSDWLITLASVAEKLPTGLQDRRFRYAMRHGTFKLGLYAPVARPRGVIPDPHSQDELYIVMTGSGVFVKDGERRNFNTHDVMFVEAGTPHHFEDYSPDFQAWVMFWGVEGGEKQSGAAG